MRAIIHYPILLSAAAVSVSCSAAAPALRVGVEPDDTNDAAVQQASSIIVTANANSPQLVTSDAGAKSWPALQLSIHADAISGSAADALSVCSGACLDVNAEIRGGNPPYAITWDDGSTIPQRRVCPQQDSVLTASVSDTAIESVEFAYKAQRQMSSLRVAVKDCTTSDAAVMPALAATSCEIPLSVPCEIAPGVRLPEDVSVDIPGATARPFAQGAMLPAGRYRIEYVDGCNTYGIGADWTIHGSTKQPGLESCFIVANGGTLLGLTPGTVGLYVGDDPDIGGAYPTYAECVAANCKDPPVDFDFAGGTLSVQRDGGGVLGAIDDAGGESMGGRSPTFRLSRLDGCNH